MIFSTGWHQECSVFYERVSFSVLWWRLHKRGHRHSRGAMGLICHATTTDQGWQLCHFIKVIYVKIPNCCQVVTLEARDRGCVTYCHATTLFANTRDLLNLNLNVMLPLRERWKSMYGLQQNLKIIWVGWVNVYDRRCLDRPCPRSSWLCMAWPEMFTRGGWVLLVGATYVSQPDGQTTIQLLVGAGGRAGH